MKGLFTMIELSRVRYLNSFTAKGEFDQNRKNRKEGKRNEERRYESFGGIDSNGDVSCFFLGGGLLKRVHLHGMQNLQKSVGGRVKENAH